MSPSLQPGEGFQATEQEGHPGGTWQSRRGEFGRPRGLEFSGEMGEEMAAQRERERPGISRWFLPVVPHPTPSAEPSLELPQSWCSRQPEQKAAKFTGHWVEYSESVASVVGKSALD